MKKKEYPDMPVRVREVKHLQSETWPNDLAIEIENVSKKPIYFINAVLEFPDDPVPDGSSGIKFKYGNIDNMDIAVIARPDDEHLNPGEKTILVIADFYRKGLLAKEKKNPANFKRLEFWFEIISFGDGTGYEASQFLDLKYLNKKSPARPAPEEQGGKKKLTARSSKNRAEKTARPEGGKSLATQKNHAAGIPVSSAPSGSCGPGSCDQYRIQHGLWGCGCFDQNNQWLTTDFAVIDTTRPCKRYKNLWFNCGASNCYNQVIDDTNSWDCPGATPRPSPTPTPCPQTNPANCPSGIARDNCTWDNPEGIDDGCEPFFHPEGVCCVRDPTPTPSATPTPDPTPDDPQDCNSWGWFWNFQNPGCYEEPQPCAGHCSPYWPLESGGCESGIDYCSYQYGCPFGFTDGGSGCCCGPTPILIDVAGNGFSLTDAYEGVHFDMGGDGHSEPIAWTTAGTDDAWLVLDRNNNGTIDSAKEMFGNFTDQAKVDRPPNGFLALAEFDRPANGGNHDRQISKRDQVFASLRLWRDSNRNGVSEASELYTLEQLGLKTIELNYKESKKTDEHGNQFKYRARVLDTNNAQLGRWAWDVILKVNPPPKK